MKTSLLVALMLALCGCRSDPGAGDYENQIDFMFPEDAGTGGMSTLLPGPDPYVEGDKRLSVGLFYEGRSSDLIEVNNMTTFFYIWENTFTSETTNDHIEGVSADAVVRTSVLWWGGGVSWSAPRDLSEWKVMRLSLKSSDPGFESVEIGMASYVAPATEGGAPGENRVVLKAEDYGHVADGEWHQVSIPLADFAAKGLDLTQIVSPFSFGGANGEAHPGERLLADDLYFEVE